MARWRSGSPRGLARGPHVEYGSTSRPDHERPAGGETGEDVVGEEAQLVDAGHEAGGDEEGAGPGGVGAAWSLGAAHIGPGEERGVRRAGSVQANPVGGRGGGDAIPGRGYGVEGAGADAQQRAGGGDREEGAGGKA